MAAGPLLHDQTAHPGTPLVGRNRGRSGAGRDVTTAAAFGFGDRLRRHRLANPLSRKELTERIGLSTRGISDLERGARTSLGSSQSRSREARA